MATSTSDFDYDLPPELVAQQPAVRRDASRLMVLNRSGGAIEDRVFADLPGLLRPGDLLVLNDTAVVPAKFECRRRTGGRVEGLFLREVRAGLWEVLLKGADRCKVGEVLMFADRADASITLAERAAPGRWRVSIAPVQPATSLLEQVGRTPLPPYIRRAGSADDPQDRAAYQTVYAAHPGAVAAPTAGLHFTPSVLGSLATKGIRTALLTLHVGIGTFAPVKVESLARHRMHAEWYDLPASTAEAVARARRQGRRVVAVGTTSLRVVETAAQVGLAAGQGWTDLFIYPPRAFSVVDALITNFHLPRSTLLMLAAAFCAPGRTDGIRLILDAYRRAVARRYRFYSYGDAMLIE